jgi:AraC family transcriptional regulator of adaptative response / DNA-3-methyladenine glycosylase II
LCYIIGMELETNTCYQALQARDTRFDGEFFVGVRTTGIYCRPICTAKTPRQENCRFFASAGAAERAGFRPCLRCRPELAPGRAPVDATSRLAATAYTRIEEGALSVGGVEDLAQELGVTSRHLRRVVETAFGVSPVALAQTQRLLLAKRLLTDTDLRVTDVAFASGFASLRRFNALFRERYRLNPTELRKTRLADAIPTILTFELAYRPPLDWDALLNFLAGRASCGVEAMEGRRYLRTVRMKGYSGWLTAETTVGRSTLRLDVSASLAPVLLPLLSRVRRLFDLSADPQQIAAHLGALAQAHPGLRVPGAFDGFEMGVRAILGQQVSVRAASTLAGRVAARFGEPIQTPFGALTHLFPTPERIAEAEIADLTALGIVTARAEAIRALARELTSGRLRLEPGWETEETVARLQALPGIGEWTAHYLAMRALGWPDAFPHTDLGIRKAMGDLSHRRLLEEAEKWRPWRAYAAMHLWKSLEPNSDERGKETKEQNS